jgi:2-iminobutanoate/2-iminopropanoate deaminase
VPTKYVSASGAPRPIGPYSQGVISGGFLFSSGQNLIAVLREAKMGPENVVKTTVYLADMADFVAMNEVYGKYLGTKPPARTTIQAAGLPRNVRVEIDVIAAY